MFKKDKMIECPNCHTKVKSTDKFCFSCGEKVEYTEEIVVENIPKRGRPKKMVTETVVDNSTSSGNETIVINSEPKISKFERSKKYIYPVIAVIITFVLCLGAFTCFYQYYLKNLVIETTKREVTVTDKGIAEAVDKVYDAVVTVENYVNGSVYSTGTGFVFKVDGDTAYIITNYHVVDGADDLQVVFTNNNREKVDLVGKESYRDVAVLAVDKESILAIAEIGSSDDMKIGDTTFAVGAPIDSSTFSGTTTRGILSGKNRMVELSLSSSNPYETVIMEVLQTDTALNNGNSGGPLCNSNGEVIGIINSGLSKTVAEGISFAIPIEQAMNIVEKIINGEKISYPYIGVMIYEAQASYRNPNASGVYIESVEKGSNAEKGGLKAGDKILSVDGTEVTDATMFKFLLYKHEIGEQVKIKVERDGKEKTLDVTLGSNSTNT